MSSKKQNASGSNPSPILNANDIEAWTSLHQAVADADVAKVREIIEEGELYVDQWSTTGRQTPLFVCVHFGGGNLEIAKMLLEAGARRKLDELILWLQRNFIKTCAHRQLLILLLQYQVSTKVTKDNKKKKRVHWQNGRNNGPLPSQETDGKGYKEKGQQHATKTMQLLAQQEQENGKMAIDLQQNERQQLDARNNEQKVIELQEQFNGEWTLNRLQRAQEVENAANAENQQPRRGCRPGLGCRPDSENATNIAMSAALGAAWGTYVAPVLGTGVGACVGAACGVGKAVHRRFTGRGRKSRKKRGRKHKRKTRKHKKKHRRRKSTHKHKKKRKKRRTTKKR